MESVATAVPNKSVAVTVDDTEDQIRNHLVTTAVKFLQNPKVRSTSLAKKHEFLRKKGLTESEIQVAFGNAGVFSDEENNNVPRDSKVLVDMHGVNRTSLFLKATDVANTIALISIGSYSLYSLWKNYIAPRIFGTRSRLEQNYERLLESIAKLNENVVELRELIREMQLQSVSRSQSSFELQEVRKEIQAIKSLLLGRSQFPSPSSTGIPSWQMVEAGDNSNENSDESSSRRRSKKDKSGTKKEPQPDDSQSERGDEEADVLQGPIRKHPSLDSNNGFNSGSSCEVVFLGKNDSSDPDHSE